MPVPLFVVDAFADRPFTGNPAAVCLPDGPPDEVWMTNLASEMNLSETAFAWPEADGYRLRWLTPTVEVKLCGHATLATAHTLWDTDRVKAGGMIRFHTKSGVLTATKSGDLIELDFPAQPMSPCPTDAAVLAALGLPSALAYGLNGTDALVVVATERELISLSPDFPALASAKVRGVIVTAKAERPGVDFVSRFFAPGSGVDEDPVTGSAHCCLTPYWGGVLGLAEMTGYQASKRGGTIHVQLVHDRVKLAGRAFTITRGECVV
jgi:PhzF family phenazine biosynthesis protein